MLPILLPCDGHNPHSVVIMDNASIHHIDRVWEIITGVGDRLMFLPPYTPDLMPLKEVLVKVKAVLKANDIAYISTQSPERLIELVFSAVTKDDHLAYIRHAFVKLCVIRMYLVQVTHQCHNMSPLFFILICI